MVTGPGVVVRGDEEDQSARPTEEFGPSAFRSVVLIEDDVGGQVERVPLYADEPMVFRLRNDWQGEGRKVGGVGVGHFIAIVPAEWTRLGDAPVDPESCVDGGFRAHYFFGERGDRQAVEGFVEHAVSSSVIDLVGKRVFDESDQGELFVGDPPVLKAPGMAWARVGEEGTQGWAETYRLDRGRSLKDVLDGRQGWFFVRVYREGRGVEVDSVQFRYLANLREIRMAGEAYTADTVLVPTPRGHTTVEVEIVSAGDLGVEVTNATDGARHFESQRGAVACPPNPEMKQLCCRVDGKRGSVDVVVGLPRVWWQLVTPGEPLKPRRDLNMTVTREEFRQLASVGAEIWIDVPEHVSRVSLGFGDESSITYPAPKNGWRRNCAVPIAHYLDHAQIDRRLFRNVVLRAHCTGSAFDLIEVAADPPPRIVDFSSAPCRVSPDDAVVVRWAVENCEAVSVSLAPSVGLVDPVGSCKIRIEHATVVTLTLSAPGMESIVEERVINVEAPKPANSKQPVACAKALGGWRHAKGFSLGELEAVMGTQRLPLRVDRRRRSLHAVNVASLERWMNEQR